MNLLRLEDDGSVEREVQLGRLEILHAMAMMCPVVPTEHIDTLDSVRPTL
jgi:hypothetical protein